MPYRKFWVPIFSYHFSLANISFPLWFSCSCLPFGDFCTLIMANQYVHLNSSTSVCFVHSICFVLGQILKIKKKQASMSVTWFVACFSARWSKTRGPHSTASWSSWKQTQCYKVLEETVKGCLYSSWKGDSLWFEVICNSSLQSVLTTYSMKYLS